MCASPPSPLLPTQRGRFLRKIPPTSKRDVSAPECLRVLSTEHTHGIMFNQCVLGGTLVLGGSMGTRGPGFLLTGFEGGGGAPLTSHSPAPHLDPNRRKASFCYLEIAKRSLSRLFS